MDDRKLFENKELFNKIVRKSRAASDNGDLELAVAWTKIAAHFAFVRHPGIYTSLELENLLVNIAQQISAPSDLTSAFTLDKSNIPGKMRFLFVITESYGTGGHSSFIARWIRNNCDKSVNSIVTTAQTAPLPDLIDEAIQDSGGWSCSLIEKSQKFVEQALFLRSISQRWADVVVLMVHPYDPLPTLAYGIDGGPPILYVNHADHAFWLGTSIADVIVDYHSSANVLSKKRRGVQDSKLLPIPLTKIVLPDPNFVNRKALGFSDEDVILLTIAREEKFYPFDEYDFLKVMVEVLKKHKNAKLIAVGPQQKGRWQDASAAANGRIYALGTVDRLILEKYFNIADMYLESFPCGSGTSILEAGQHGLPLLGLAIDDLPHFRSGDDVAFKKFNIQVSSIQDYHTAIDSMIKEASLHHESARMVKKNIEHEHCSPHWNRYLDNILNSMPLKHKLRTLQPVTDVPEYSDFYWENLSAQSRFNEMPELSMCRLVRAYSKHLSTDNMVAAQAENIIPAFTKINSFKRSRQFFNGLRELVNSALQ